MNEVMRIDQQSCVPQTSASPAIAEDSGASPAGPMVFTVGQGGGPMLKLVSPMPIDGAAPQLIKVIPGVVSTSDGAHSDGRVAQGTVMVQKKLEDGQQSEVLSPRVYSIVQKPTQTLTNVIASSPAMSAVKTTFNNGQQRVHTLSALPSTARVMPANVAAASTQKVQILSNVVVSKQNIVLNKNTLQAQRQIITTPLSQKQLNNTTPKNTIAKPIQSQIQIQQSQPKVSAVNNVVLTTNQPKALVNNPVQLQKNLKPIGGNLTRPQVVQPQKTIKTLSPQSPQAGYAPKPTGIKTLSPQMNHFNKQLQNPINKMSNQRIGIKTLAPQRPGNNNTRNNTIAQRPNYIGKHATQAVKSGRNNMQIKNRNVTQRSAGALSPTKYNNQKSSSLPSTGSRNTAEISFNTTQNYPMQSPPDDTSLSEDIGEEVRPDFSPNLSYLYQVVMLDHNYGAPPPALSPPPILSRSSGAHLSPGASSGLNGTINSSREREAISVSQKRSQRLNSTTVVANLSSVGLQSHEDDAQSTISSDGANVEDGDEGEETETAPEGEGDEDGITRCICDFDHDDGYMICCDVCSSWQHVDCMGLDREHIPEKYSCVKCQPRRVDRQHARAIQQRKREEFARAGVVVGPVNSSSGAPSGSLGADRGSGSGNHSDTSSESSTESDRDRHSVSLNNNVTKKRSAPVSAAGRRKSEPVRRTPLAHKRQQRRESAAAASASAANRRTALKKREKKQVVKRKMKSRSSLDESSQDSWPSNYTNMGTSLLQLRQWIENYEEAVTNHYSPELRARITNMRANGQHQNDSKEKSPEKDAKQAPATAAQDVQVQKCRLGNQPLTGIKVVLATQSLASNTPVIELRGKYMLSTQHRASGGGNSGALLTRAHSQRPGPFLFFYRLPRDGTEVCVDTRTYGNDARFIRRSCRPNAELRHLVEKGTLHLYIITTSPVDKNCELTLKHESHDLAAIAAASMGPTLHSTASSIPCACGGAPATCLLYSHRSNGLEQTPDEVEVPRKRRGRRASSPKKATPPPSPPMSPTRTERVPEKEVPKEPPEKEKEHEKMVTRRSSGHRTSTRALSEEKFKETREKEPKEPKEKDEKEVTGKEVKGKKENKKMTRDERKMEAIMKAFERMEKAEQRRIEVQARQAHRKDDHPTPSSAPTKNVPNTSAAPNVKQENGDSERENVRTRRKKRKGRARTVSTNSQPSTRRRTRLNSTDSYMTSGDESSLLSPPLPSTNTSQTVNNSSSSPTKSIPEDTHEDLASPTRERIDKIDKLASSGSQTSEMSSPGQVNTAAGLLLALANGGTSQNIQSVPPGPPSGGQSVQEEKNENDSSGSNSLTSSPGTPLSSACLLVAAAVGPLEAGFKFPKTKKAIMNEWLNKSPDQPPDDFPPSLPSIPPQSPQFQPFDLYSSTKNLATLVQAATLCDSPQTYPQGGKSVNSGGNAKKRWLRQAISEECDSPCRPEEETGNQEPVAPPKKRRLARESLSSEEKFTPPTTPTGLVPPNHSLDDENFPNNDEEFYETQQSTLSDSSPPNMEENSKRVGISGGLGSNYHNEIDSDIKEQNNLTTSLLDSGLGRDPRPVFRDSAQLLGTVEKTIRFYEENLTGPVNPPIPPTQPPEPPATPPPIPQPDIVEIHKSPEIVLQPTISITVELDTPSPQNLMEEPSTPTPSPETTAVAIVASPTPPIITKVSKEPEIKEKPPVQPKPEIITPAKRKLSISEYRQRKQLRVPGRSSSPSLDRPPSPETPPKSESPLLTASMTSITQIITKPRLRSRSASSSSATSSLSSDEDILIGGVDKSDSGGEKENKVTPIPIAAEPQVLVAFNSAPTAVELQRENVERLKKAFGLALDDESRRHTNPIREKLISPILQLSPEKSLDSPSSNISITSNNISPNISANVSPTISSNIANKFSLLDSKFSPKRVEKSVTISSPPSPSEEEEKTSDSKPEEPKETKLDPFSKFEESTSFIPPFNNPVYPNSTQFTSFSSVIDSSPYEGRNPSPPPSELLK